jgi:Flp pilus assembly pilin Flp
MKWRASICAPGKPGPRWARRIRRLHRDERGYTMLDYVLVFAFIALPLILLFGKMFDIIASYFSMVAYYVTWPFL